MNMLLNRRLESNLWKLKLNNFLLNFFVYSPILFVSFQEKGMSLAGIGVMMTLATIAGFLFEVPTGILADRWGRKYMLILAGAAGIITMLLWTTHIIFALIVGQIFRSLVNAAISGADTALLYDTLVELKKEGQYTKHNGQRVAWGMFSFAVAGVLASLLPLTDFYKYHFVLTAVAFAAAMAIAITLQEPKLHKSAKSALSHLSAAFQYTRKHREVYKIVLYSVALGGTLMFMLIHIQFFLKQAGISTQHFGFIYAGLGIVSTIVSYNTSRIEQRIGERAVVMFLPASLILGAVFLIAGSSPLPILIGFLFMELMLGMQSVVLSAYLQRHLASMQRSTIESLSSFYRHVFQAVLFFLAGFIADIWSIDVALTFVVGVMLFLIAPPLYFLVKESGEIPFKAQ